MKTLLLVTLLLSIGSGTAHACLNDRDVLVAEREFRSEYLEGKKPSDSAEAGQPLGWVAALAGVGLLAACPFILRKKP